MQAPAQLLGRGQNQITHLVEDRGAVTHQPVALDQQKSGSLPVSVGAGLPDEASGQRRSDCQERVDGIALAGTPGSPSRPIHLGDFRADWVSSHGLAGTSRTGPSARERAGHASAGSR